MFLPDVMQAPDPPDAEGQRGETSSGCAFPLLVKFLFTADKLSVQVHPSDEYAWKKEGCPGKTEMWHVLKAEPNARLAVGFREDLACGPQPNRETLREAVSTGAIEGMLNWIEVQAGDTFFVPAGTVHAIGPGLVLCEIQQNSDLTYRLYDYQRLGTDGRPRPLHVEKALDVLRWRTAGGRTIPLDLRPNGTSTGLLLAACRYFAAEKLWLKTPATYRTEGRLEIWTGLEGQAEFEMMGQRTGCRKGEVVLLPACAQTFLVNPSPDCIFLRSYRPDFETDLVAPLQAEGFSEEQLRRVCFLGKPLAPRDPA